MASLAQQRDDALRLTERIRADQMRALREQSDRVEQLRNLLIRIAMAEDRERKGRLGDEHVALHQLERHARRVGHVLVVAGSHDAQVAGFDGNLRRAEHMAGRMERHFGAAQIEALAIADRLAGTGEVLAVAKPHEIERLLRRQHGAMTGARMVGMGVRNQRALDRPRRIDMKGTELAAHAGGRRNQDVFRPHIES